MANIKNFGIAGVSADVQMGKSGGRLVYDSGNTLYKFTTSDGSTLAKLRVAEPSGSTDVATKNYVDGVASGLDVKDSVRVATTAAGTLASSFANGQTVDGVSLATSDRILIKDQADGSENGIYTVNASGAPTRATDADANAEVTAGLFTFVEAGTNNADTGWVLSTDGAITVGTTSIAFAQFSGAGSIVAGAGLTKSGNTLNVVAGTGITVNANDVQISATYAGQNTITTLGTVGTGTWQGTAVADAYVADALTISGGTVNNSVIGGSTPAAGTFTTLTASGALTGTLATAAQPNVTSLGTLTSVLVDQINIDGQTISTQSGSADINLTPHGNGEVNITKVDIDSGAIDNTVIGATTAAAGTFAALTSTGTSTHASVDINGGSIDGTNIGGSVVGTGAFSTLSATGTATLPTINGSGTWTNTGSLVASSVDINGGAIDGTAIGASSAGTGAFTTLTASGNINMNGLLTAGNVDISGGEIDGTIIGANAQAAGTFTALTVLGTAGLTTVDIDGGAIDGTNIGASSQGTGRFSSLQADTLAGALNASSQAITNVNIDSGAIDGTPIGASSPSTGAFTSATTSGNFTASGDIQGVNVTATGNLSVTGNATIDGNITIGGSSVTANVTTITVQDPLVILGGGADVDIGIIGNRAGTNVGMIYDNSAGEWAAVSTSEDGSTAGNVSHSLTKFAASDIRGVGTFSNAGTTNLNGHTNIVSGNFDMQGNGAVDLGSGSVTSTGTQTHQGQSVLTTVDINGGAIDGTAIGASSASTGAFSTLSATGTSTLSTVDINGGAIDGTTIGASSQTTGNFTTLEFDTLQGSGGTTVTTIMDEDNMGSNNANALATQQSIKAYVDSKSAAQSDLAVAGDSGSDNITIGSETLTIAGTNNEIETSMSGSTLTVGLPNAITVNTVTGDLTGNVSGNVTSTGTSTFTTVDINGGAIDGTAIGANSISSGAFSTLSATGTSTLSTVDINGGAIDGTTIGQSVRGTGFFDALNVNGQVDFTSTLNATGTSNLTTVDINGGAIDGTTIGAGSASTGAFTTGTFSQTLGVTGIGSFASAVGIDGDFDINTNKFTVAAASGNTNVAGTLGVTGTTTASGGVIGDLTGDVTGDVAGDVTSTGTSTFATVDINGGAIDGTAIGASAVSTGAFSTVTTSGNATVGGNLSVTGNTTVTGNLTVNGTTTDVSTTNTQIEDNLIIVNSGESGAGVTNTFAGITVDRGSEQNAHMAFDDGQDRWEFLTGNDTIGSASLGNVAFGTVGAGTWQGNAIADAYVADALTISGGTVNNSVIGGSSAAAGTFTTLTATTLGGALDAGNHNITNVDIDSGAIDGTVIGAASAAAITGTTITASGSLVGTLGTASQTNITGLGTIGTGVWQGTRVAAAYGGTGIDTSSSTGAVRVDSGTWSVGDISLTADVSGTLPVANGGTGVTSGTAGQFLKFTGATTIGAGYADSLYANSVKVFNVAGATTSGGGEGLAMTNASGRVNLRSVNTAASGDVDLYLGAQGSGDVVIEGTGNGIVKGDNDLDLTVRGGDAASADAGDLILSGGNGTGGNASGNVYIQGGLGGSANGNVQIRDASGNEVLKFSETGSAVNEMTIANAATSGTPTLSTTGGDAAISLLISPKGTGVVNVPAGYAARAGFGTNSLATKEYVDDNSSTETFARRASFTANSSADDFAVGTINSGTTNYVNRVTVDVTTVLAGGSVSGVRLHDGSAYLTALDDCDTSVAGTYVIDLPTSTATAASATLTAKIVQSNGTTAAVPTSGTVVVTAQWVKV